MITKQLYAILALSLLWSAPQVTATPSLPQAIVEWATLERYSQSPHPAEHDPEAGASSQFLKNMLHASLMRVNLDWQWQCHLCSELPTLENGRVKRLTKDSQTKLQTRWTIRHDANWGDGKPIVAADFILSWKIQTKNFDQPASKISRLASIFEARVDEQDQKSFYLTFYTDAADYYKLDVFFPTPSHIEAQIWEKYNSSSSSSYQKQSSYQKSPSLSGLYSGPFIVDEVRPQMKLIPNPYFFAQNSNIDLVRLHSFSNIAQVRLAMRQSRINLVLSDLAAQIQGDFEPSPKSQIRVLKQISRRQDLLVFNMRNPTLGDRRLRQALVLALDLESITNRLSDFEILSPAFTFQHPSDSLYKLAVKKAGTAQPARAKAILEEGGWRKDEDGIYHRAGVTLSVDIDIVSENPLRKAYADAISTAWREFGIISKVKSHRSAAYYGPLLKRGQFSGATIISAQLEPDQLPVTMLHSSFIPTRENNFQGQNFSAWRNREIDSLIAKYQRSFSRVEQQEIVATILSEVDRVVPMIALATGVDTTIIPDWLIGWQPTPYISLQGVGASRWRHSLDQSHPARYSPF